MNHAKVAIIGAGPAGIACAVQLKRNGTEFFLFEKNQTGGLFRNANLVENYLGFESGISGQFLIEKFKKNLEDLNINPILTEIKKVSFLDNNFHLKTNTDLFTSEFLVIASGTNPKELTLNLSERQNPPEIFYEIADLPEKNYQGKIFIIIGAGDAAFDYALNLVNNYNALEIIILNRNNNAKCLPLLEKKAKKTGKIKHLKNIQVKNIEKTNKKMILSCITGNNSFNIDADFIISATGREPCLNFLDDKLLKDSLTLQKEGLLNFIGDVTNENYRQTSIATGDGIKTAMKIYNRTDSTS